MTNKTDWIALFYQDRKSMARIMRENAASDLLAGYSVGQIAKQMSRIEDYEKETEMLLQKFKREWNGQSLAYHDLKRRGAIA